MRGRARAIFGSGRWIQAFSAALAVCFGAGGMSAAPVFIGLGDLPGGSFESYGNDVSADGGVVVGSSRAADGTHAFRWTPDGGFEDLGPGSANGVSADGSVVVGGTPSAGSPTSSVAFRWSSADGMQILGDLPGGRVSASASAVSADGSIVVGTSDSGAEQEITLNGPRTIRSSGEAFRWSAETGMQPLGLVWPDDVGYFDYWSHANGISADGRIIVGAGTVGSHAARLDPRDDTTIFDQPLLWVDGAGPRPIALNYSSEGTFLGISPDGTTLTGGTVPGGGGPGVWMTLSPDGTVALGGYAAENSTVSDASLYGNVLVGYTIDDPHPEAYVLFGGGSESHFLNDYVRNVLGLDIGNWDLREAAAVSWDGQTLVGSGINPSGQPEAWLLVIPEPAVAHSLALGLAGLALSRRRARGSRARRG